MQGHKITIDISQEFSDGTVRRCAVVNNYGEYHDEPQGQIGEAVGNALRQILSAQNTGCNAEFWMAFLKEIACLKDGGDWVYRLHDAIERWWRGCGDSDISLREYMDSVIRKETIQETAARLKINRHDSNVPPGRFAEDAGAE